MPLLNWRTIGLFAIVTCVIHVFFANPPLARTLIVQDSRVAEPSPPPAEAAAQLSPPPAEAVAQQSPLPAEAAAQPSLPPAEVAAQPNPPPAKVASLAVATRGWADSERAQAREAFDVKHSHFEKKARQGFKLPLSDHEVTVVSGFATFGWWSGVASGIWEMTTFRAFNQELRPDMVYVGFGEWAGVTGLFAAQRVRKVILMDSDPMAYAELRFNMKLNRPTVKALMETDPRCISSEKGTVRPNPGSSRQGVRGDGARPGKPWTLNPEP